MLLSYQYNLLVFVLSKCFQFAAVCLQTMLILTNLKPNLIRHKFYLEHYYTSLLVHRFYCCLLFGSRNIGFVVQQVQPKIIGVNFSKQKPASLEYSNPMYSHQSHSNFPSQRLTQESSTDSCKLLNLSSSSYLTIANSCRHGSIHSEGRMKINIRHYISLQQLFKSVSVFRKFVTNFQILHNRNIVRSNKQEATSSPPIYSLL